MISTRLAPFSTPLINLYQAPLAARSLMAEVVLTPQEIASSLKSNSQTGEKEMQIRHPMVAISKKVGKLHLVGWHGGPLPGRVEPAKGKIWSPAHRCTMVPTSLVSTPPCLS